MLRFNKVQEGAAPWKKGWKDRKRGRRGLERPSTEGEKDQQGLTPKGGVACKSPYAHVMRVITSVGVCFFAAIVKRSYDTVDVFAEAFGNATTAVVTAAGDSAVQIVPIFLQFTAALGVTGLLLVGQYVTRGGRRRSGR